MNTTTSITVRVADAALREAASKGFDEFLQLVIDSTKRAIGGELTADTMSRLNSDQVTLLAWDIVHTELMDGGFVQLIYNGYGPFVFKNPLAKAFGLWGLRDLRKLIYDAHTLYTRYAEVIEREMSDEEFMALYERCPEFDDLDDRFVESEEQFTEQIAEYVDNHLERFIEVTD